MTEHDGKDGTGKKRDRFVIQDGGIEVTGHRAPADEEKDEADRVFNRILKKRRPGKG